MLVSDASSCSGLLFLRRFRSRTLSVFAASSVSAALTPNFVSRQDGLVLLVLPRLRRSALCCRFGWSAARVTDFSFLFRVASALPS
jgi:hypothetical protein